MILISYSTSVLGVHQTRQGLRHLGTTTDVHISG